LTGADELVPMTERVSKLLLKHRISTKLDASGTAIGRRYSRTDEIGCPFGVTIDFEGLANETVTLRERDSTEQVRAPVKELGKILTDLINEETTWHEVKAKYPAVTQKEDQ